ncbi:LysR family transcriptional regulator [Xanthomonas arboricola]|uniref:LysR family transcriptional regulator n=4 Tax=Xanthomonas TaxID=338 RepID=A0A8E4EIU3_XANCJ|nr:LysR family transcriptional regulator [Xanthomonas arboricola]KOB03208.1 LysR family transcriptional regulator [Xanthomonas arboricola]KOB17361.1 LysR family transcriptional regulator [Xanthomonas arboricola]KOB33454.1 LysR family transcriptional regulator [Xanthomonas arboricola]MDN0206257.1 LysR family transcriptional regulator [Xanthomonas arboricola pv. corylina]MDN0210257.1 LysR family transcriptional regulator [Xanthomonas arboricola pv. corylina]
MELRHLRYFLAVAEKGNFTRAAARVGIGQPPLSQQIQALERDLGTPLFRRTHSGAELTPAGEAFLVEVRRVLADVERAAETARRVARGESGRLRLGFTASAAFNPVVPHLIRDFRRQWPQVELLLEETNTAGLLLALALADGRLDAAFVRYGLSTPPDLQLLRFADEPMKIAVPTAHRLAARNSAPLAALAGEPFILFPRSFGSSLYDEILAACRQSGVTLRITQEAPQMSSIVNLVAAELGVSVVPASTAQLQLPGVRYLDIEGQMPLARLALAVAPGALDTAPLVRHLWALAEVL